MAPLPANEAPRPRRLLMLGVMLGTTTVLALIVLWQFLPLLAPQFVIRHSPWIWPIIRAEAFDTEGKEPDPARTRPMPERASLIDRLYEEEDWLRPALPLLSTALGHPDVRIRRTSTQTLLSIRNDGLHHHGVDLGQRSITDRLLRLLDDPDQEVFASSFTLLSDHTDATVAQALLPHLPRACGLTGDETQRKRWFNRFGYVEGEPHPMRFLRLASPFDTATRWLESGDDRLQQLACVTLGFSDDPRALDLLIAHLGRHHEDNDRDEISPMGVGDPVAYGLSESRDPRATATINQALSDPIATKRLSAVCAAHWRAAPESLHLLVGMIGETDPGIRIEIARAISAYPLEQTIDDVIAIIGRGGLPAQEMTRLVRWNLMRRGFAMRLKASTSNWSESPEFLALRALVFTRLTALLPSSGPAIRIAIIEYLGLTGEHGGDEVRRCLGALADDADPQVRAAVAAARSQIEERLKRR